MSIHVENNSASVRVSSDNQNIWAEGDRAAITWHEYFPILGGARLYHRISDAKILQGQGKVTIDGERLNWDPEGAYDSLRLRQVETIVIEYTTTTAGGVSETRQVEIEARGTLAGTGYVMPETGQTATDEMNFAAVDADDILQNQVMFDKVVPIDVTWDAMEAFEPAIDELLDGLATAQATALRAYTIVARQATNAENIWETAKDNAALANATAATFAEYRVKLGLAQSAQLAYTTADALADMLADAQIERNAKLAARTVAETGVNTANRALDLAENGLNAAKGALTAAADAVDDFIDDMLDDAPGWLTGTINFIADFLGLRDALDSLRDIRDRASDRVDDWIDAVEAREIDLSQAQDALSDAQDAFNDAADAVIEASADLAEALGGRTLFQLQRIANGAEAAKNAALADYQEAREEMWDAGVLTNKTVPSAADLAALNAQVAGALANKLGLEASEAAALVAYQAAQAAHAAAREGVDQTELTVDAEAAVTIEAQAGLQVDLVLDAGSVDSDIDYGVETTTTLDTEADTLTLSAFATNETTGESVAFETVSPNMSIYAGIVYNIDAHFELLLDLFAKVAGHVLVDTDGPVTIDETVSLEGWIDILNVDTTELGGFDVPIPTWVGDILSLEVTVPTVETEGRAADVDAQVYTDPTGFSMDELADAILNIAETRLDFSPEFRALLIEQGMSDDVFSNDLGQAFADALQSILKTVIGDGDTDGDGVVPIFMVDNTDEGVDGIFHLNTIADVIDEIDINEVGSLGFFVGEGDSDNIFQVSVDVDQLVATAVNVALKNAPDTAINPLDLSIGMDKIAQKLAVPADVMTQIQKFISVEFGFEAADFDVRAGMNMSQKFALSVDDMDWQVTFEDGTTGAFKTSEGGEIVIEDASGLVDVNGDGEIGYTLALTPDATFFNDTQVGLNVGYTLDFLKAKAEFLASLPLAEVFGDFDWGLLGFDSAPSMPIAGFDLGLGPILRMEGDLDLLSADVFEDIFAFNAGSAVLEGSFTPVAAEDGGLSGVIKTGNGGNNRLVGTKDDDLLKGLGGRDILIGKAGDDALEGGRGQDKARGGGGDDSLEGGQGRDVLLGNKGDDALTGGLGRDVFRFKQGDGSDVITDFTVGADIIKIGAGATDMDDLTFTQVGDDVNVAFANVDILVENMTVAVLDAEANFAL